ncbi:spermine synthase [Halorhodospira halochloris]|uniref:Spermidine synthase n=1 Tax=Halorhodospira halochloris TaxID=1052 RepID=A0A120MZ49_HALHR|nr:spermine synthase [Halorhodospira halochloris]MBK1651060.1 spermine synthase [Halorhodospira halochloris]MCG5529419.1 spermine synthase [Halorhodospira halochloris]BAU56426.1 spermidine synthase [Halorhodospira halochloris]
MQPEYVRYNQEVVERRSSAYQNIVIAYDPSVGHLLYLDDDLQIADADTPYNQAIISPLVDNDSYAESLILGGGDGGVLRGLLDAGAQRAVLVDIDGEVIELAKQYLPNLCGDAFERDGAEVIVGDAFAFLDAPDTWDGIVYDLTMDPIRVDQPRTDYICEIFAKVRRRLRPGGVMSMQCCGANEPGLREEIRAGLAATFPEWGDWEAEIPSFDVPWVFAWAKVGK